MNKILYCTLECKFTSHYKSRYLPTLMTSEQPDKYAYCKIENNQIVTFLKKCDFFRIKFKLFGDNVLYKSKLKLPICLNIVIHCRKSTLDMLK